MTTTDKTLELVKAARDPGNDLAKTAANWVQPGSATSGIAAYDLEAPAKLLYPVNTPLRNRIPRVSGKGGIQANWRAITGINVNLLSGAVAEGKRGGVVQHTTKDYLAAYRGVGLEDYVTWEAEYAAEYFDDLKARAVNGLLWSTFLEEEKMILGANGTKALGVTPTPVLTAGTAGTLGVIDLSVICVALAPDAYWAMGGFNNGFTGTVTDVTGNIPTSVTRANADGTSDTYGGGSAQKSVAATHSYGSGATNSAAMTVAAVPGAVAYAWFWGTAGNELLGAITTYNAYTITATATGTQNASDFASDHSVNALEFDGLLTQIVTSGSGSYVKSLDGAKITSDNAGGVVEIDAALQSFWDNYRLSPDTMYVSSQQSQDIGKIIIAGGAAPLYRLNVNGESAQNISAGIRVTEYLNKITGTMVKIEIHPNITKGMIMFYSESIPYKLSNVNNVVQMRTRKEYYQIEWPIKTRRWDYGVYADEVLQNFFPPAFGIIYNIKDGI